MTDYKGLCLYCFKELSDGEICPHCGNNCFEPVGVNHLTPGTMLNGRIVVGRAIGEDQTGIVYAAYDTQIGCLLRLREYFPEGIAQRMADGSVTAQEGMEAEFDAGRAELVERAAGRSAFFEEKGTCYFARKEKKAEEEKPSSIEDAAPEEPIEGKKVTRQVVVLGAVIVVVLIGGVALLLSLMGRKAADTTKQTEIVDTPTSEWVAPTEEPATVEATEDPADREIVDPGTKKWQDEDSGYDEEEEYTEEEYVEEDEDEEFYVEPSATPVADYTKASSAQIRELQWRLIELRWLSAEKPTGKYDKATKQAVKDFQRYVNENYNANLTVDGICGRKTANWLEDEDAPTRPETPTEEPTYAPTYTPTEEPVAKPTLTPTQKPTPEPTEEPIDYDAAYTTLYELGWEDVLLFQQYVNETVYEQKVLPETGEMDEETARFLVELTEDNRDIFVKPEPTEEPIDTDAAWNVLNKLGWEDIYTFQHFVGLSESGAMDDETALFLLSLSEEDMAQYVYVEPIDMDAALDVLNNLGWEDVLLFQRYAGLSESGAMDDETALFLLDLSEEDMAQYVYVEPIDMDAALDVLNKLGWEDISAFQQYVGLSESGAMDDETALFLLGLSEEDMAQYVYVEPIDMDAALDVLNKLGWEDIYAFQQYAGLSESGAMDDETALFLLDLSEEDMAQYVYVEPIDMDAALDVLNKLGWEDIYAFQQYAGLSETGEMDDETALFLLDLSEEDMAQYVYVEPIDMDAALDVLNKLGWEDIYAFQQYAGLTESGEMDDETALFLLSLTDEEMETYAKPMEEPEPEEEPEPDEEPAEEMSAEEKYDYACEWLFAMGWLDETAEDPLTYDAVLSFQQAVNSILGEETLEESGELDEATIECILNMDEETAMLFNLNNNTEE